MIREENSIFGSFEVRINSKNDKLYQDLIKVGQELKNHNLVMIIRRYKKDFQNYFIALADYKKNPKKYTGKPQLPKPRKLSKLTHYSIPIAELINRIWNADLNGAVNHLKIAFNSSFQWLQDYLFKLCNPIKFKSVSDFLLFNVECKNSKAGKVYLSNGGQTIK